MATMLFHTAMSLDGFVAGPRGDLSWMSGSGGPNPTRDALLGRIGALLIGGRTFHGHEAVVGAGSDEGAPYGGAWTGPMFVLTHRPPAEPVPGYTFVDDLAAGVAAARAAAGDGYVAILGATTARGCLAAGELDEILVHIVPVLVGDGTRLFDHPGGTRVGLERINVTSSPRMTDLWFRVTRPA
jgi:dihydrofolate reductase